MLSPQIFLVLPQTIKILSRLSEIFVILSVCLLLISEKAAANDEDAPYYRKPVARTSRKFLASGSDDKRGVFISPGYPEPYSADLASTYIFNGEKGQRVRLEFTDFDVFHGGAHCPSDELKIFDGQNEQAPLIGMYCGQQSNLTIYSRSENLFVIFTTRDANEDGEHRGFKGSFEFSENFVKINFIKKGVGTHIPGTECDQRIFTTDSDNSNKGALQSPTYSIENGPDVVCHTYFYGLQCPPLLKSKTLSNEEEDDDDAAADHELNMKNCREKYKNVSQTVYETLSEEDVQRICGAIFFPDKMKNEDTNLIITHKNGEIGGSLFNASYRFETDYRVGGSKVRDPNGSCHFTYYSTGVIKTEADVNSPQIFSNCTYKFWQHGERVRIVFDRIKSKSEKRGNNTRWDPCREDWVEIYYIIESEEQLLGRYCRATTPGTIVMLQKPHALKVILNCGVEEIYSWFNASFIHFSSNVERFLINSHSTTLKLTCASHYALQFFAVMVLSLAFTRCLH